jgi:hypothetical protein
MDAVDSVAADDIRDDIERALSHVGSPIHPDEAAVRMHATASASFRGTD